MDNSQLVLVVDDSPHIVKLIQVNLEFEGYKTLGAFDGKEALEKVTREKPDLIILDILMPNMDGWDVLERLKRNPRTANIPVIVLTAFGRTEDRRRGLELGVSDYVTKPFNALRLIEAVQHTLHRTPMPGTQGAKAGTTTTHVAVVGEGDRALGILQTLLGNSKVKILGLATDDAQSPAAKLAKELKIPVNDDAYALCKLPNLDLLIETEPRALDIEKVKTINPSLEVLHGFSTQFVWGLVEEKEASEARGRGLVKELHSKIKELNALYEAGKVMSSAVSLPAILEFVLRHMAVFVNAQSGVCFSKKDNGYVPAAVHGKPASSLLRNWKTLLHLVTQSGKPMHHQNVSGVNHVILVPLGLTEAPAAFAALIFPETAEISGNDLGFLDTLSGGVKIAIERATLYHDLKESKEQIEKLLSKVILAQEEERKRVSAEIHDSIAQSLVGALTRVQMCEGLVPKQSKTAQRELKELKTLIQDSIKEVRQIIFNLRPSTLDDLGLVPTLEHYLKKFEKETRIRASLSAKLPPEKLPSAIETTLYRVVQEALTNVRKHAKATRVRLDLKAVKGKLHLSIHDNGAGMKKIKSSPAPSGEGVGIIGMKERVELLGGTFAVGSRNGKGSLISIEIPL